MSKSKDKNKLPRSVRKYIRKQKAFLRKGSLTTEEYKEKVKELYKKFGIL